MNKVNKIFRNIQINEYAGDIVINAVVNHTTNKKLIYNIYIRSTKDDLNAPQNGKLHLEEQAMDIAVFPAEGIDAQPVSFKYFGTWDNLLNNIKSSLLDLNRKKESEYLGLQFALDNAQTNYFIFVKSSDKLQSHFAEVLTHNDPNFVKAERVIGKVKDLNNTEVIDMLTKYIYDAVVVVEEDEEAE